MLTKVFWSLLIGWGIGILTVVVPQSYSAYTHPSDGKNALKKCEETYPSQLGWDPQMKAEGAFFTDATGSYHIFRNKEDFENARTGAKKDRFWYYHHTTTPTPIPDPNIQDHPSQQHPKDLPEGTR